MDHGQAGNLHEFMDAARTEVEPQDLGLDLRPGRRAPGLTQDDVAAVLNVSRRWYLDFEHGKATASDEMLDRIAGILRLKGAVRKRLYELAKGHPPPPASVPAPDSSPQDLARFAHSLGRWSIPALVTDVAWNVLTLNDALTSQFPAVAAGPPAGRNMALWAFTPEAASTVATISTLQRAHIGWFNMALAERPHDPRLARLATLLTRFPAARKLRENGQLAEFTTCIIPLRIHAAGRLTCADLFAAEYTGGYRLFIAVLSDGPAE